MGIRETKQMLIKLGDMVIDKLVTDLADEPTYKVSTKKLTKAQEVPYFRLNSKGRGRSAMIELYAVPPGDKKEKLIGTYILDERDLDPVSMKSTILRYCKELIDRFVYMSQGDIWLQTQQQITDYTIQHVLPHTRKYFTQLPLSPVDNPVVSFNKYPGYEYLMYFIPDQFIIRAVSHKAIALFKSLNKGKDIKTAYTWDLGSITLLIDNLINAIESKEKSE